MSKQYEFTDIGPHGLGKSLFVVQMPHTALRSGDTFSWEGANNIFVVTSVIVKKTLTEHHDWSEDQGDWITSNITDFSTEVRFRALNGAWHGRIVDGKMYAYVDGMGFQGWETESNKIVPTIVEVKLR